MQQCTSTDRLLYHATPRKNLANIDKHGLLLKHCDIENVIAFHYDFVSYDQPEYTLEQARQDVQPMIFATDEISGINNITDDSIVIGILPACHDRFHQQDINAFGEYVSFQDIDPSCLCRIPETDF